MKYLIFICCHWLFICTMFFCPEAAGTTLTVTPPYPSFAIETRDLTLVWKYTLDGSVLFAQFLNITDGGGGDTIARRVQRGSVDVEPKYQDRFTVVITDSQASLKIRGVQSSDQGKYRFTLSASGSGNIFDEVEVIVQGNTNCISLNEINIHCTCSSIIMRNNLHPKELEASESAHIIP